MSKIWGTRIEDLRRRIAEIPRCSLGHFPTPLEKIDCFTEAITGSAANSGLSLWIKRDDCTGLALGGNKTRHNEFLIGDALSKGADLVVWGAGVQSNNCRQTAAACARVGLDCHLVLGRGETSDVPVDFQGNLLLDHLLGAMIEIVPEGVGTELVRKIKQRAEQYRQQGRQPYFWDPPIVKPLAALSYALCYFEIVEQLEAEGCEADLIYVSSAGSTGAGMALGKALLKHPAEVKIIAPMDWPWDTRADLAKTARDAAKLLGIDLTLRSEEIDIRFDQIAPGYGIPSPRGNEALGLLARTEGILTDPIYSAKALAGLIDDIRQGLVAEGSRVVFVHTGGTPALFAYSEELKAGVPGRTSWS